VLHRKVFSGHKMGDRILGTRPSSFSQSNGQVIKVNFTVTIQRIFQRFGVSIEGLLTLGSDD